MTREEAIDRLKENFCAMCAYGSQNMGSCDIRSCDNRDAIKALEQEQCTDAISRQDVLEKAVYTETEEGWYGYTVDVEYIKSLPSVTPQPKTGHWIPVGWIPNGRWGYPNPEDEYKHFLTIDNKGEQTVQEFLLSIDEDPQPYFTGMRNIVAWQPLPEPYEPQESEGEGMSKCRYNLSEDCNNKDCVDCVLDKIRAEITDWQTDIHDNEHDAETYDFVFERIYEIFDEYKAESEDKECI